MLKLTLKPGESLKVGDDVKLTVIVSTHHRIQLQVNAPKEVDIRRIKMEAPQIVVTGSRQMLKKHN